MKRKKVLGWTVGILTGCCLVGLAGYNLCTNSHFWEASAVNCITMAIAVLVSYFFVQRKSDRRKQKEILLDLIYKLQEQIAHPSMYDVAQLTKEELTMRNRSIANKIRILELHKEKFGFGSEATSLTKHFDEYRTLIDDHIEDYDYLKQSKRELQRPLDLIDRMLIEVAMKLYE